MRVNYSKKSVNQAITLLNSKSKGISQQEAKERLAHYGKNEIKTTKEISRLGLILDQIKNPLIYILLIAILVSLFLKSFLDAAVISIIIILNTMFGYYQEFKSEKALLSLKKLEVPNAKVMRGGIIKSIPSTRLVPGDIIILETGDKIPADARIIESFSLKVNESVLTGESKAVEKSVKQLDKDLQIADQSNMIFSGTIVSYGRGKAVVSGTGYKTEFGKIAHELESINEEETPIKKKMSKFGKNLGMIVLGVIFIVLVLGLIKGMPLSEIFMTSLSLAVSAIPEGLPAVITICLALGIQRMIKDKALVRRLAAVETLGATTVICSDKTGTMTSGEMTITKIYANKKVITVTGSGYKTEGNFLYNRNEINKKEINKLLETGMLCNDSQLKNKNFIGDPTEIAFLVAAKKAEINSEFRRVDEVPFDSSKKYMASIDRSGSKTYTHMKGAPEIVLDKCKYIYDRGGIKLLSERDKKNILAKNEEFAKSALRVLGLAYSKSKSQKDMVFLGLVGIEDLPRDEVKGALKLCKKAGIRVIMITGDNKITAEAVAKQLNLNTTSLEGKDLDNLSKEQLAKKIKDIGIFARVNPEHKVRILEALQYNGEIVAMTGDGINDAPALKKADVGIAMGKSGTDVTRETSDIILLDDNFATIVDAVKEGRTIFDNIKKFIKYLLSANFDEMGVILASMFMGLPLPLLPLQILWINLVTDSLPALALGVDPSEEGIMDRKPRNPKDGILKGTKTFLILAGILGAIATLSLFSLEYLQTGDIDKARTIALTTSVVFELLLVFSCRSETKNIFQVGFLTNKYLIGAVLIAFSLQLLVIYSPLAVAFKLVPLGLFDWAKIVGVTVIGVGIMEIRKFFLPKTI
ncbi:HAD-IC family P-type ATPase [archaeon]|jgi:P-type Ca2+ transporter type 2C|nr:HAD-IC family P-type ATPase [archaeon]MBT6823819.1 HAD-IC family P-type ATPase [archaeon]MBT7107146.1 HAD-IC family P-type ATPase [archaeon]MBT7297256.1 HAD-IC family P-type ATPase [archaeon]